MLNNKWFCEPDRYRESWCFAIIRIKESEKLKHISSWELGYGNTGQLTRIEKSSQKEESEVIHGFLNELSLCRKKRLRIATINEKDLKILRTRCFHFKFNDASLQNLSFFFLDRLAKTYFDLECEKEERILDKLIDILEISYNNSTDSEIFRRVLAKIGPLMPRGVFNERQP